jgi:hypothetical protein
MSKKFVVVIVHHSHKPLELRTVGVCVCVYVIQDTGSQPYQTWGHIHPFLSTRGQPGYK